MTVNPETTTPSTAFSCSICCEPSGDLCVRCTKDVCVNHRCEKCNRCSDCCQCELRRAHD